MLEARLEAARERVQSDAHPPADASVSAPMASAPSVRSQPSSPAAQPSRDDVADAEEPVSEPAAETVSSEDSGPMHIDEAAEAAFLAEARERGEPVRTSASAEAEPVEDLDPKALPKLDDLVNRLSPEVRETLEDLFRARFHNVKRVPKKALKERPEARG